MSNSDWYELSCRVDRFCYDNQDCLRVNVRAAYSNYTGSDDFKSSLLWDSDFPASVGFPLFLLFGTTGLCAYFPRHSVGAYILAALFIAFGFLVRYYAKHVISLTSWRLFRRHQYPIVVREYVDEFRDIDTIEAETPSEVDSINKFYDACIRELEMDYFHYLKDTKDPKPDKRTAKLK